MNHNSDTKRLAEAVANLARTITEIIELKVRELAPTATAGKPAHAEIDVLSPAEGWVGKKHLAEHFNVSRRTIDNWMNQRWIPYIRIGRTVRFKLRDVDEALNRRAGIVSRY